MNKRKNIVAGNWKMNKTFEEGLELAKAIANGLALSETMVILAPPYIHLQALRNLLKDKTNLYLAAQNCHYEKSGAFTGEISVSMLQSVGVDYVIIGHSERRQYFRESNAELAKKVDLALEAGLKPIFCCGEPLSIRQAGNHIEFVATQLKESLFHLSEEQFQQLVVAYEPIWAIGTGVTASKEQAQEMHKALRGLLKDKYGEAAAGQTSILYGGSVKPGNALELFSQPDVDGGLVGGASLKSADFLQIVGAFSEINV